MKKTKIYIKDLPKDLNLRGIKVKTKGGLVGFWYSQWNKGVWLKSDMNNGDVNPVFVDDLKECYDWQVLNYVPQSCKSSEAGTE